ncbi:MULTISPECIES: MarR family winged helix-turn-helix transcriptional regulator [unclassified Novosphingobium]|uniref:MarR family winged helix-turn-helix transcriptional regulator n=1 Tax=unclassified Novosphingobium TaxID=2644732 RepID=UPI0025F529FF|nr:MULTISPECIES: MarR family winged helix-turn-helix transcriptional regulator [unclassified Novosphingobium]HQV03422.1 MarR family winged helix-turn-helix transcriptional regulator [Novosphingobium sp.]
MPDPTRLADFVPYLMSVTTNAVSDLIADEYRSTYGLKIPEWRVMAVLGDSGAHTQRELVHATRMDKVAVNRACKVLEERSLVRRSPNAQDGRSHHLELTASGKTMHGKIMPHALEIEQRLLTPLNAEERVQFVSLLHRINASAEALEEGKTK